MNPWASIWLRPRQTIRHIVDTDPTQLVLALAACAGAANLVMQLFGPIAKAGWPLVPSILIVLVVGALLGLFGLYVFGALYRWVGSWFGGLASHPQVRAAIAWTEVPTFFVFLVWLVLAVVAPQGVVGERAPSNMAGTVATIMFLLAASALTIWRLVLQCHTLGEVHGFSAWKGLGTIVIPQFLLLVPVFMVVMLAAIAIPNVLRARVTANESATVGNLRSLTASLEFYRVEKQLYPSTKAWSQLPAPTAFKTVGPLSGHEVQGYQYSYVSAGDAHYALRAAPVGAGAYRYFFTDETAVIRHCRSTQSGVQADANDHPIDQDPGPC